MILYQNGVVVKKLEGKPPKAVNIRGTNGSGKTYLVKQWLAKQNAAPYPPICHNLLGGFIQRYVPQYYTLNDGGQVLGSYQTDCGGCDRFSHATSDGTSHDVVRHLIQERLVQGAKYVVFEGIIISTVYENWHLFSQTLAGGMLWVYLDTPLDVCLKRVYGRNGNKLINEDYVRAKVRSTESTRLKAVASGEKVAVLHWEDCCQEFAELMKVYQK